MRDPFGLRRVIQPVGAMPQPAWQLDATPVCGDDEILLDVDVLNIDSASFAQIKSEVGEDVEQVARRMKEIVATRGKHHNPVTGSGGMLIGRVREIGPLATAQGRLHEGERIATLVSLSLTPLHLDEITNVDLTSGQVRVRGHAVLFDSGIYAVMPDDLPDALTLAVCDVCGAPAQVVRLVQEGQQVVVLGAGGKSGMMVLAQARRNLGRSGKLIAVEYAEKSAHAVRKLGYADEVVVCDARNPIETLQTLLPALGDALADLTINCVSVPGTELASILVTRERGLVYFFSMATSFTAAALGAEGFGKDVDMMIGNGYAKGHAELAFALVREERPLYQALMAKL